MYWWFGWSGLRDHCTCYTYSNTTTRNSSGSATRVSFVVEYTFIYTTYILCSNGCLLPPHPLNGKYMIQSGSTYQVNRVVSDSTIITMNCNQGYILSDTNFFFCNKVTWEPPLNKGYCVRKCFVFVLDIFVFMYCFLKVRALHCNRPTLMMLVVRTGMDLEIAVRQYKAPSLILNAKLSTLDRIG